MIKTYEQALEFVINSEYANLATHQDENPINEHDCAMLICEHAEQLETELADKDKQLTEARAEIERLRQELRDNSTLAARQIVPLELALDDARAEIERKGKLIEQMRRALAVACLYEMSSAHMETIDAALSAAERGGK